MLVEDSVILTGPNFFQESLNDALVTPTGGVQTVLADALATAGTPAGSSGQIQFNNGGVFGGISSVGTGNVVRAAAPSISAVTLTGGGTFSGTFTGGSYNGLQIATGSSTTAYDALISVTGPGTTAGQGTLTYEAGAHVFQTLDNTTQFSVGTIPQAAEYWQARGGVTSSGAVLYARNAAGTGNVDGVIAAQNSGNIWLGNANGVLAEFADAGSIAMSVAFKYTPSDGTLPLIIGGTTTSSRVPIAIIPPNAGALVMNIPDSTSTGGNARGTNSIDFQQSRNAASQVASGANSMIACGVNNTAAGADQLVGGFSNTVNNQAAGAFAMGNTNLLTGTGASSAPGGAFANDWGNLHKLVFGSGFFSDNSLGAWHGLQILHASTASTAATRLTAGNGAPAADTRNVANFNTDNTWAALRIEIVGVDMTAVTTNYVKWLVPDGFAARATGVASVAVGGMTATAVLTAGTGASATLSAITADTTNGGINITVTAPNSNRWHWSARIEQIAGG